jgi:hypothetical protein
MSHIIAERVREQKFPDPHILDLEDVQVRVHVGLTPGDTHVCMMLCISA